MLGMGFSLTRSVADDKGLGEKLGVSSTTIGKKNKDLTTLSHIFFIVYQQVSLMI